MIVIQIFATLAGLLLAFWCFLAIILIVAAALNWQSCVVILAFAAFVWNKRKEQSDG